MRNLLVDPSNLGGGSEAVSRESAEFDKILCMLVTLDFRQRLLTRNRAIAKSKRTAAMPMERSDEAHGTGLLVQARETHHFAIMSYSEPISLREGRTTHATSSTCTTDGQR